MPFVRRKRRTKKLPQFSISLSQIVASFFTLGRTLISRFEVEESSGLRAGAGSLSGEHHCKYEHVGIFVFAQEEKRLSRASYIEFYPRFASRIYHRVCTYLFRHLSIVSSWKTVSSFTSRRNACCHSAVHYLRIACKRRKTQNSRDGKS